MLLSKEVLERVYRFECNRFDDSNHTSSVTLYWKVKWWQFWLPKKLVIRMSIIAGSNDGHVRADPEWCKLVEQLNEWFGKLAQ